MREKIVQGTVELIVLAVLIGGLIMCMCETESFEQQLFNSFLGLALMMVGAMIEFLLHSDEVNLNQEVTEEIDERDKCALYIEQIKENIEYEYFMKYGEIYGERGDKELYDELFGVICDVVCVERKSIRVNKGNCPYELIKSRFLKLTRSHLEYVMECMKKTAAKIENIQAYLITSLYNALNTKNHYYQQEALYDVYGCCVG